MCNVFRTSHHLLKRNMILLICASLITLIPHSGRCQDRKQTPALSPNEMYRDIFPLGASNFTQIVFNDLFPWIVLPHSGSLDLSWKKTAVQLRGMVRFGMIDSQNEAKLLEKLKIKDSQIARVYPYGSKQIKKKYLKDVKSPLQAVREVEESFPCSLEKLGDAKALNAFFIEAYLARPTRFPAVFFTKEENCRSVPLVFRSIAVRMEKFFQFRLLVNPTEADLQMIGLDVSRFYPIPGLLVIMVESSEGGFDKRNMKSYAVQFGTSKELNYTNLLHFLLNVNSQLRHKLPGDSMSDVKEIMTAEEVILAEKSIFDLRRAPDIPPDPVTTPTPPETQIPDPYLGQNRRARDEF